LVTESRENSWSALVKKNIQNSPPQQATQAATQAHPDEEAPVRHQNRKPKQRGGQQSQAPAPTVGTLPLYNLFRLSLSLTCVLIPTDAAKLEKDIEAKLHESAQRVAELKVMKDQLSKFQGANSEFGQLTEQKKVLEDRLHTIEKEAADLRKQIDSIAKRCQELDGAKAKLAKDIADKSKLV